MVPGAHLLITLTRWIKWIGQGKLGPANAAIALTALYCVVQVACLSLVSYLTATSASIDDAEQLIYLPHLWAGYGGSQPPLYTWMVWGISHILGTNMLTLKVVKYLILFVAFFSVHAALRSLGCSRLTATAGSFGMMTLPQIFWEAQHSLTHTVAAVGFSALALLALVHLVKARTTLAHVLFGLACALATLAKFNDVVFLAAILAAALSVREYRPAILDRRLILSIVVMLAALAPTILWSFEHPGAILARTYKFGIQEADQGFLMTRAGGIAELAWAIFLFCGITVAIWAVAFMLEWQNPFSRTEPNPNEMFVRRILIFGLVLMVLLVIASGSTTIRNRWLTPLLFLVPAYIGVRTEGFGLVGRKVQIHFIAAAIATAVLVAPLTWYLQAKGGDGKSSSARLDYEALYTDLLAEGPVQTIIGKSSWIGNFRLVRPELILLNEEVPGFGKLLREPAVLVWLDDDRPDSKIVEVLQQAGYEQSGPSKRVLVPERFGNSDGRQVSFARWEKRMKTEADASEARKTND